MINEELITVCNDHTEIRREVETLKARSMAKKRARQREIINNIVMSIIVVAATIILLLIARETIKLEPRYAIASELQTNGNHYIYVTERKCIVTEIENDSVTVSYKGNEYAFYGNGYEVGTEIICQFTDEMEIVGVVE